MPLESKMLRWRDAEQAACDAEQRLAGVGQGASDPRMGEMLAQARALRQVADQLFADLLESLPPEPGRMGPGGPPRG